MQDTDLPIVMDELPNFKLKNIEQKQFEEGQTFSEQDQYDTAYEFIQSLQDYLTLKKVDKDGLYILYDYTFNHLCKTVFAEGLWPAPEEIEKKYSTEDKDVEFDMNVSYFYNELCYRHAFARLQKSENFDFKIIAESWDNYQEIFELLNEDGFNYPLPSSWVWDIVDEFIYQFQIACKLRASAKEGDESLKTLIEQAKKSKNTVVYWNLETIVTVLEKVVQDSQVIKEISGIRQLNEGKNETLTYFGHFALVGLIRVHVITGKYDKAVNALEQINYNSLFVFSKAVPSYLTLFYYAGTSYLMTQKYNEAVNLFQAIVMFFLKYKQFLSKSFQYENMRNQADKCLVLLSLSSVFYPTNLEDTIKQKFEEFSIKTGFNNNTKTEQLSDKIKKLQRFDKNAFNEIFNKGFVKAFYVIKDNKDFCELGFQDSYNKSELYDSRNKLDKEFQDIKYLNDISSILKIYSNVKTEKVQKMLNISEEQLNNYLEKYKGRSQRSLRKNVPFEQTILQRFVGNEVQLNFKIENGCIFVTETATERNYVEYFTKLNANILAVDEQLSQIGNIKN